jgi:hypothetical protein
MIDEFLQKTVFSFSDCSYIIYTGDSFINNFDYYNTKEENIDFFSQTKTSFHIFVDVCICDIANTIALFMKNGFLCRGGITHGDLYFDEKKNIIFSPAIDEAYQLETISEMPRIIIDDILGAGHINFIKNWDPRRYTFDFCNPIIKDYYDNRYFLNYLYFMAGFGRFVNDKKINILNNKFKHQYGFTLVYDIAKKKSNKTIKTTEDHKIIAKHNWQLNYLERINTSFKDYCKNMAI